MEPIDKWEEMKEGIIKKNPEHYKIVNFDWASLYPSAFKIYKPDSESEEKIQTLNESRLKPIKP